MADTERLMEAEAEDKVEERTEERDDNMEGPPLKKTRNESAEGLNLSGSTTEKRAPDDMERAQEKTKVRLKNKYKFIYEDTATGSSRLEKVYTQLDIIPDIDKRDLVIHEILHKFSIKGTTPLSHNKTRLDCLDLFNQQLLNGRWVKRVMTKGIAGIGKTVVVQWFSHQWAEGKSNQHIDFIFELTFRELNMLNETVCSLFELLCHFAPELRELEDPQRLVDKQVLFILDGLDECRFPLDFVGNKSVHDLAETSTVDVLLTNLIKGNMFPNALLWITSRPAAVNRIRPFIDIDQMTGIHGFTHQQTEEYFRKRFNDDRAKEILSRIEGMMSFSFMSHIPIFCWIIAEVFQKGQGDQKRETITTITELYSHYLLIQTQRSVMRYEEYKTEEMDLKEILEYRPFAIFLKLAQLAFEQLEKGNIMFYKEDLRRCGLDVDNASVFCGLCSEILKQECGLYEEKVFSFVHLSFQEFLAAVHVFYCCVTKNIGALKSVLGNVSADLTCHELMKRVVDEALRRKNGQLDMLLCFFLGISLESNQTLLQGFLPQTENGSKTAEEMRRYIREPHVGDISPERQMNLFLCMYEMKAQRVHNEIQTFLKSGADLSPIDCAVLSSMLLMSEEVLAEINLVAICDWDEEEEKHQGLLPAVKNCRKATLYAYEDMDILKSIVQAEDSSLRELHLVATPYAATEGLWSVLTALPAPGCKLETLRLSGFPLGHKECKLLTGVIQSTPSLLRELDLRCRFLPHDDDESPSIALSTALMDPTCKLEKFRMSGSHLTSEVCKAFTSVLCSKSRLSELDLSYNDLQDSGVKHLSAGLGSPDCRLEILRLAGCKVTEEGCASLASALGSNPSHLRELDLSFNHPGDLGTKLLSDRLKDPNCTLEKLNLDHDEEHWINPQLLKKWEGVQLALHSCSSIHPPIYSSLPPCQ